MAARIIPGLIARRITPLAEQAIVEHTFPPTLKPNQEITGTITVTNNTTAAAAWTVNVIPQWATEKATSASATIDAGASHTFTFPGDFAPTENLPLLMPNQTATLTIRVTDAAGNVIAEVTATIEVLWYQKLIFGIPTWALLVGGGVFLALMFAMARKKK